MKNKITFLSIVFLAFTFTVSAHQPRLVFDEANSEQNPFVINNPDISQAFYGEFKNNEPEYFRVTLPQEMSFYLSLLVPDNQNASKEVSAIMIKLNSPESSIPLSLSGKNFDWKKYYEEFAGDNYLQGPSEEKILPAGEYLIKVESKDNVGKYVVVIGKIESFPFMESVKTIFALPDLKMEFFETSFFSVFSGIIGKGLLILIVIIIILIFGIYKIIKFILRTRKNI